MPIDTMPVREAPASVGQRLLWFLDHYRVGDAALNCPILCRIDGPLEIARLRCAVGGLLVRHEALRTTVERRGRRFWQTVHAPPDLELDVIDLMGEPTPDAAALHRIHDELHRRIDPAGIPVRVTIWRTGQLRHFFCLNVHHLATDAWSGSIQMRDLKILYEREAGDHALFPLPTLQYVDFTLTQEEYFQSERFEPDLRYWRERLAEAEFDSIPLAPPAASRDRNTTAARISFNAYKTNSLKSLARSCKATLFSLMLSLYFTTLHRMTGKGNLAVASVFANRMRPAIQNTVGFIANLVVLQSSARAGASFRSILHSVQVDVREALVHQACPLHLLPAEITVHKGRRADEAVFQMLPQELNRSRMRDVDITLVAPESIESRFDFEVTALMEQGELALIVFWNRERLSQEWVSDFLREFASGAESIMLNADRCAI